MFDIQRYCQTLKAVCARNGIHNEINMNSDIGNILMSTLIPLCDLFFDSIHNDILFFQYYYYFYYYLDIKLQMKAVYEGYINKLKEFYGRIEEVLKDIGIKTCYYNRGQVMNTIQIKVGQTKHRVEIERRKYFDLGQSLIQKYMAATCIFFI